MRVASDIGGTFTDLVSLDERTGRLGSAKVDTTPPEFERGVIDTLRRAGVDVQAINFFVHGTTVIINALTERKGVRTGLITTRGFRDVLEIGRANRPDLYNLTYAKPRPFVPRALRLEVTERVNYKGEVLVPLADDEVLAAAAGVIGAAAIGRVVREANLISLDIGGTTAKTSLVERGDVKVTTDYKIEWTRASAGYPIKIPVVDIVEIGAGGGSIAWIDEAGSLHVGPQSAGAMPGPACYGRGGREPTVTDANVVAGRINPAYFLGGEIALDVTRAREALGPIARHFGISVEAAALGVIRLANANMVNALKLVSVHRGYDPRDFTLVAFGGGGAMHATALAEELRIARVLIPTNPAVFSAWGMLMTDLRYDLIWTSILRTQAAVNDGLDRMWRTLEDQARTYFAQARVEPIRLVFQRFADMRYAGQEHTVKVPVPAGAMTAAAIGEVEGRFHALHEQRYTFRLPSAVEFVNFHLTTFGTVDKPRVPRLRTAKSGARGGGKGAGRGALKGRREVDFDAHGRLASAVYERDRLRPGAAVSGPAIIEEPAATTVLFPGQRATVDAYGNLMIESERAR